MVFRPYPYLCEALVQEHLYSLHELGQAYDPLSAVCLQHAQDLAHTEHAQKLQRGRGGRGGGA